MAPLFFGILYDSSPRKPLKFAFSFSKNPTRSVLLAINISGIKAGKGKASELAE